MIKISILHNDGKVAEIKDFSETEISRFIGCVSNNKMYWNPATERGFWANPLTIRHIIAEPQFNSRSENVSKAKEISSKDGENSKKDSGGT